MEMHQVRYFLAVCETLNFTRAAERCHVAQPSLTRAIKKLEEELGGPLLRRERTRTHLTELGELMRPHLQQLHDAARAAQAEAEGYRELDTAPLKLGVMSTIGPAQLVGFFHRLRREVPSLDVTIREKPGARIVDELMAGALDIAIVGMPDYPERLDARPLYHERYVIAFPHGHPFENLPAVPLKELDGEDYLSREHCEFPDHLAALGLPEPYTVKIKYKSVREEWIQALVLAGMGSAIMPEHLPSLPGIATRVLVEPEVGRTISLVTVAGRRYTPTVETFIRMARGFDWQVVR